MNATLNSSTSYFYIGIECCNIANVVWESIDAIHQSRRLSFTILKGRDKISGFRLTRPHRDRKIQREREGRRII